MILKLFNFSSKMMVLGFNLNKDYCILIRGVNQNRVRARVRVRVRVHVRVRVGVRVHVNQNRVSERSPCANEEKYSK